MLPIVNSGKSQFLGTEQPSNFMKIYKSNGTPVVLPITGTIFNPVNITVFPITDNFEQYENVGTTIIYKGLDSNLHRLSYSISCFIDPPPASVTFCLTINDLLESSATYSRLDGTYHTITGSTIIPLNNNDVIALKIEPPGSHNLTIKYMNIIAQQL